jgi:aconitate hydratase
MQDFTGVPVVVDLTAMRSAMQRLGGDPTKVNPSIPVDLVIDHSVQVDFFGTPQALQLNADVEFKRNHERYELLHWGQKAFENFRVVPPSTGIVHQVNLEYLSQVVLTNTQDGRKVVFPDTLVGTDSHTTMINGLGIVGWGVGGIEAIAAMLGQPLEMLVPDVIGFKLHGKLPEGVTPTDLTLTITQMLRKKGVVDKFVEFYGAGLSQIPLTDRAMIANMSPENGATITFFPVDHLTLEYLRLTGRSPEQVELVEAYCKEQGLFRTDQTPEAEYTETIELDLGDVEPSLAGPKRPQDRVSLTRMKSVFNQALAAPRNEGGYAVKPEDLRKSVPLTLGGQETKLSQGAVAIAAITSCTNTSNPFVMVGAGLLARKAVAMGLTVQPYVKTSLAPGSRVVTDYLTKADLMDPLAELGFDLVGYGCTTCIGNSGPLEEPVAEAISGNDLVVAAVLSGNRNFEGRINPFTQANYLASPPLVVAYALAGTVDIDLATEPLGIGRQGQLVYLRDIWPSSQEIYDTISRSIDPEMFRANYAEVLTGNETWNRIESGDAEIYSWNPDSTYIQEPPYFEQLGQGKPVVKDICDARVLAVLGDSITTDHISPAGAIPANTPAGRYLIEHGVVVSDFNSYGSRRGNDRVMTRGTFANIRLKNQMVPGVEGGMTRHLPDDESMSIFDAAMKYKEEGVPLVVLAGKEYGTGSSRDWAAKGAMLLGMRAVIAESFERIHRSNLAGMGILPLQFKPGESWKSLGLTGDEVLDIQGLEMIQSPGGEVSVKARRLDGTSLDFQALVRLNTTLEVDYFHNGGIMNTVLLDMLS